jgi:hypothetical protein
MAAGAFSPSWYRAPAMAKPSYPFLLAELEKGGNELVGWARFSDLGRTVEINLVAFG